MVHVVNETIEVVSREALKELVTQRATELCDRCNSDTLDRVARVSKEIHLGGKLLEVKFGSNIYTVMSSKLPIYVDNITVDIEKDEFNLDMYIPVIRHDN